ncbi:MAG: hypothetical protein HY888_12040 [Deltaproteobacteria bacterium]|nr:hypothetical protein [Deltaproteobacteria bacterium]
MKVKSNNSAGFLGQILAVVFCLLVMNTSGFAVDFPAAGWHRGDVTVAQEDSRAALEKALHSASPNIECDLIDFIDQDGKRTGLISHDYTMKRGTGMDGVFNTYHDRSKLPKNATNQKQQPEPYMTVLELFDLIKARKDEGVTPIVSLDMKEEGEQAEEFGRWIGELIRKYGFQKHVFASSFFKNNVVGVKAACNECLVGGLVFNDHYALKHLSYNYTSLDLTGISKLTYFLGFLGKEEYPHDFVLFQDDIYFKNPELLDYWKNVRKVKFVGVFVYNKERGYTDEEWNLLKKIDWLELDPPQMNQYLKNR